MVDTTPQQIEYNGEFKSLKDLLNHYQSLEQLESNTNITLSENQAIVFGRYYNAKEEIREESLSQDISSNLFRFRRRNPNFTIVRSGNRFVVRNNKGRFAKVPNYIKHLNKKVKSK